MYQLTFYTTDGTLEERIVKQDGPTLKVELVNKTNTLISVYDMFENFKTKRYNSLKDITEYYSNTLKWRVINVRPLGI